jgi:GTPase
LYGREIPYSCEVQIASLRETGDTVYLSAVVYVERLSQVGILIGKNGCAVARLGAYAKPDLKDMFKKHVFLDLNVKCAKQWRSCDKHLKTFGYDNNS